MTLLLWQRSRQLRRKRESRFRASTQNGNISCTFQRANGDGPALLVVMLHGCTQNPETFADSTGMNVHAEGGRFLVLGERPLWSLGTLEATNAKGQ